MKTSMLIFILATASVSAGDCEGLHEYCVMTSGENREQAGLDWLPMNTKTGLGGGECGKVYQTVVGPKLIAFKTINLNRITACDETKNELKSYNDVEGLNELYFMDKSAGKGCIVFESNDKKEYLAFIMMRKITGYDLNCFNNMVEHGLKTYQMPVMTMYVNIQLFFILNIYHNLGWTHQDLHGGNVYLDRELLVVMIDHGLAVKYDLNMPEEGQLAIGVKNSPLKDFSNLADILNEMITSTDKPDPVDFVNTALQDSIIELKKYNFNDPTAAANFLSKTMNGYKKALEDMFDKKFIKKIGPPVPDPLIGYRRAYIQFFEDLSTLVDKASKLSAYDPDYVSYEYYIRIVYSCLPMLPTLVYNQIKDRLSDGFKKAFDDIKDTNSEDYMIWMKGIALRHIKSMENMRKEKEINKSNKWRMLTQKQMQIQLLV